MTLLNEKPVHPRACYLLNTQQREETKVLDLRWIWTRERSNGTSVDLCFVPQDRLHRPIPLLSAPVSFPHWRCISRFLHVCYAHTKPRDVTSPNTVVYQLLVPKSTNCFDRHILRNQVRWKLLYPPSAAGFLSAEQQNSCLNFWWRIFFKF